MKEFIPTISITELAHLKDCSRQTIYNNIDWFNRTEDGRIIYDKLVEEWEPDKTKGKPKASK